MAYINESSEKSTNQSVTKLMQLFEYLSESRVPMRLQDIAAAIGVSQATHGIQYAAPFPTLLWRAMCFRIKLQVDTPQPGKYVA